MNRYKVLLAHVFSLKEMFVLYVFIPESVRVSLEGRERPKVSAGRLQRNPWLHVIYSTFWQAHMKIQAVAAGLWMRK